MSKKPFVNIGRAGSLKMTGNEVVDRQLVRAKKVDGAAIVDGNVERSSSSSGQDQAWWKSTLNQILIGIAATVVGGGIIYMLGWA